MQIMRCQNPPCQNNVVVAENKILPRKKMENVIDRKLKGCASPLITQIIASALPSPLSLDNKGVTVLQSALSNQVFWVHPRYFGCSMCLCVSLKTRYSVI